VTYEENAHPTCVQWYKTPKQHSPLPSRIDGAVVACVQDQDIACILGPERMGSFRCCGHRVGSHADSEPRGVPHPNEFRATDLNLISIMRNAIAPDDSVVASTIVNNGLGSVGIHDVYIAEHF
jgi:hypothetical protein